MLCRFLSHKHGGNLTFNTGKSIESCTWLAPSVGWQTTDSGRGAFLLCLFTLSSPGIEHTKETVWKLVLCRFMPYPPIPKPHSAWFVGQSIPLSVHLKI